MKIIREEFYRDRSVQLADIPIGTSAMLEDELILVVIGRTNEYTKCLKFIKGNKCAGIFEYLNVTKVYPIEITELKYIVL